MRGSRVRFFVPEEFKSYPFVKMASFGAIPFRVKVAVPLENGKAAKEVGEHLRSSTSIFSCELTSFK